MKSKKQFHTVNVDGIEVPYCLAVRMGNKECYDLYNGIIPEDTLVDNPYEFNRKGCQNWDNGE